MAEALKQYTASLINGGTHDCGPFTQHVRDDKGNIKEIKSTKPLIFNGQTPIVIDEVWARRLAPTGRFNIQMIDPTLQEQIGRPTESGDIVSPAGLKQAVLDAVRDIFGQAASADIPIASLLGSSGAGSKGSVSNPKTETPQSLSDDEILKILSGSGSAKGAGKGKEGPDPEVEALKAKLEAQEAELADLRKLHSQEGSASEVTGASSGDQGDDADKSAGAKKTEAGAGKSTSKAS